MPAIPSFDIATFEYLPEYPVILRGHRPALICDGLGALLDYLKVSRLSAYGDGKAYDYLELDASEVLADFTAGRLRYGIAASPIPPEADPEDRLAVPAVIDAGNLFSLHPESRFLRKSLVVTQAGGFTRMHVDAVGMAGWMYLYAGRKRWHLWEPAFAPLFYDVVADSYHDDGEGDPHPDERCQAILDALPRWEGEIAAGELIWFPEGWLHRVWTLENSFGFGGSSLHARRLGQAVHSWLWELRLGHSESFDFPALLRAAAAEGHDTSGLMALIEETLARWRKNRA